MSKELKYPSEKDLEKNRLLCTIEGASARTIFNLTSGAFLVGFLKYMGASDTVCGYIIAIPVLAAFIQFLSPIVLESLPYRKKIITIGCLIHRVLLSALVIMPFLPASKEIKLWGTGIIFFISYSSVAFVTPAVSNMYVSFVPQSIRGKYFGKRESYILIVTTAVALILGKVLDTLKAANNELAGYVVVYAVILIFTIINTASLISIKEVPLLHSNDRIKISEIFTLPFKNKRFMTYFIMLIIWNMSIQFAGAYFSVYLKSDLGISYTTITILFMVQSIVYVLTAGLWGKFADKNGWSTTTMLAIGSLGICHALWFLTFKGSPLVLVFMTLTHILAGISWSGINVALFNIQFDFAPDEKRTVYIGLSAATSGIIGYISAVLGAQLVGLFGSNKIVVFGVSFDIKQLLFLASATLLTICALYIRTFMHKKVKKEN